MEDTISEDPVEATINLVILTLKGQDIFNDSDVIFLDMFMSSCRSSQFFFLMDSDIGSGFRHWLSLFGDVIGPRYDRDAVNDWVNDALSDDLAEMINLKSNGVREESMSRIMAVWYIMMANTTGTRLVVN